MKKVLFVLMVACVAVSFAGRLKITNDTGSYDFFFVQISPASSEGWGDDMLRSDEVISPDETKSFRLDNGTYDLRVEDEDGDEYIFWDVYVSGTVNVYVSIDDLGEQNWGSSSSDGTASITIENDLESYTIYNVYGSSSDSPFGDDRLGADLLEPGESITFYVDANDYYDFMVIDEDEDEYSLWEVWVDEDGFYWDVEISDMD